VLCDSFNRTPPLHTPYNPPYVSELFELVMNPCLEMRLYHTAIPSTVPEVATTTKIIRIDPSRLAGDFLPLFQSAYLNHPAFAPPDATEAAHLLKSWDISPLSALVALVNEKLVGFVLLQNDIGEAMQRARGGKNLFWHCWLSWKSRKPTRVGRLLSGGILPELRRQEIGRQLWLAALNFARETGWQELTIGPVIENSEAAHFLEAMGATAQQHYRLYTSEE
jgi:ribosomal protein S18 acetylase RimI-like enzyme